MTVWNILKLNPFALPCALTFIIQKVVPRLEATLIVCSCNVLSDQDVRGAVSASAALPRTARQLYGCLGCSAECGRCARTINKIIKDALGACARECAAGCPHAREAEPQIAVVLHVSRVSTA